MNNNKIFSYISDNKLDIEKVMDEYTNYVYVIIKNSYTNFSNEDIEEIALDVFLTLWNNQNRLNYNKKLSSYIAGITRNLIKKKYRDIINTDNIEDYEMILSDIENIELNFIHKEKNQIIKEEMERLKEEDKIIFHLYYYDEKSIKDIAKSLNVSESKIKSKLFRIRKRLHKRLKKRGYDANEKQ